MKETTKKLGFGTLPVFLTAISTILGAILFLRFGYAVGTLGFVGVLLIILVGHLVTIPTSLALSEIATNTRVEGGGEYFIISRSFGLNIGATIGIALYLSQAISVAFYVIAFTEAFEPFFSWFKQSFGWELPRQAISMPAMGLLTWLILKKGANMGMKALYIVVAILAVSLILFFLGKPEYSQTNSVSLFSGSVRNMGDFFIVFAICFPAFTGMTAGVGLSGDLKNPSKSIPIGTIAGTLCGMIIYIFIAWKMTVSASPSDLMSDQLIMSKIAIFGFLIIPLGLAASTISSALGSIMVAPRTLQALASDKSFPISKLNSILAKGKAENNEPFNASVLTCIIAFIFVAMGSVNAVAEVISMFFMLTYGSLCLISFLNHFGADPSYRPTFKSKWFISFVGFLMCLWLMFKINAGYAFAAIILMSFVYIYISSYHKERGGMENIFRGAMFQLSRKLHVFLQHTKKSSKLSTWRPSAICITKSSFESEKAMNLMNWVSYKYGFGSYIHMIEGYYSKASHKQAEELLEKLIEISEHKNSNVYLDTIISPSYTSAIAQIIQLPSISGLENNMIVFEFEKNNPTNLQQIVDNYSLIHAGDNDICILSYTEKETIFKKGIHVWIQSTDQENSSLMIMLSYIILGHPDWKKAKITIFDICKEEELEETHKKLHDLVQTGRLPISSHNIEIICKEANVSPKVLINQKSASAALTLIGFRSEHLKHGGTNLFKGYDNVGDILFVNAHKKREIE